MVIIAQSGQLLNARGFSWWNFANETSPTYLQCVVYEGLLKYTFQVIYLFKFQINTKSIPEHRPFKSSYFSIVCPFNPMFVNS